MNRVNTSQYRASRKGNDMTNQTILSLLNYICNEARNSVQASFGLMALRPGLAPDPAWQSLHREQQSRRGSAAALHRRYPGVAVDRNAPLLDPAEEFDVTLCLGETIELLNLASGDRASRLILRSAAATRNRSAASARHRAGADARSRRRLETRPEGRRAGHRGRRQTTATASGSRSYRPTPTSRYASPIG